MEQFPIPAPQFDGASRRLDAGSVFDWFRQGWAIFAANPAVWIAMMVLMIVIYVGLAVVPVIGYLAAYLLTPLLAAGMLLACRKAVIGEALEVGDLFAGFRRDTGALMTLGVFYMLAMLLLVVLVFLSLGGGIAGGLVLANPLGVGIALGGIAVRAIPDIRRQADQIAALVARCAFHPCALVAVDGKRAGRMIVTFRVQRQVFPAGVLATGQTQRIHDGIEARQCGSGDGLE